MQNTIQLSDSNKSKFLAYMSYELRSVLTVITGFAGLMRETSLDLVQKKYIGTIAESSELLQNLIAELLDTEKIISGRIEPKCEIFELHELLDEIVKMSERRKQNGVEFNYELKGERPIFLYGDSAHICQICLNLLENAFDYTATGKVELSVEIDKNYLALQANQICNLCIAVKDTGCGIDDDDCRKIFDPFYRGKSVEGIKLDRIGIGLTVVKNLSQSMCGSVKVESKKGIGSEFVVELSVLKAEGSEELKNRYNASLNKAKQIAQQNYKLLLVDDNYVHALMICEALSRKGIILETAENGEKAIEMLKRNSYQAILMDIMMPVMDGITATRIIRKEIDKKIPIIGISAVSQQQDIDKAVESGMNEYFVKPLDFNKLVNVCHNLLNAKCEV